MGKGLWLILLYVVIVVFPLCLMASYDPLSHKGIVYEIGKSFGIIGFMILSLQAVLAARIKWIDRFFGLDIVIRFHKYMAVFAALFFLLHPLFLAWGGAGWKLIFSINLPLSIWLGKLALLILVINILVSLFQTQLKLKFERWRIIHDVMVPCLLSLAFIHSWFIGSDMQIAILWLLWPCILIWVAVIFIYHRFWRVLRLSHHPYRVIGVQQETKNVWTIKLASPNDERRYDYLPGQFQFLTFHRGNNLPVEEHHWTISSSPAEKNYVSSTIKETGDFTSTIGQTKPGDSAIVHAPFGRFSYVLHPDESDLVFLAGGIGVTPLMSMLRHMHDTHVNTPVLLIYASKNENEIVFREELSEIQEEGCPQLRIVHVLSRPGKRWAGETGHIDREKIRRFCGSNLKDKFFYLCCPPGLFKATIKNLRSLGVSDKQIHAEIFSFLN